MWTDKFRKIMSFVMAFAIMFSWIPAEALEVEQGDAESIVSADDLSGKTLSILGDSISTFSNYSNGTAALTTNSTIADGAVYYPRSGFEVTAETTWWYQAAEELDLELLVNNSWSGSCLLKERSGTVGAYVDRCVQLHDDTGDNAGQKPDMIAIFLGTNDYYTYPGTLGSYESIDFDGLITEEASGFVYAEPTTSMEAYAISLHKTIQAYPDSEVYCFTLLPRVNSTNQPTAFNEDICQLAEYFGVYTVDLYDCGIRSDSGAFYMLMGDSLHPDDPGMDAITNAFVSAVLKNSGVITCDISFALEDVLAMEGTTRTVTAGSAFETNLSPLDASLPLEITVTMGGVDITESCRNGSTIKIPSVTADVVITAKPGQREPVNFRWETKDDVFVSVTTDNNLENPLTMTHGTITDGTFSKTRFAMSQGIRLRHDLPWCVEWKSSGTWTDTTDGALLFSQANTSSTADACYFYRRHNNDFFAFGTCTGGRYHNYGVKFAGTGIDTTAEHVFRLKNRIASDGSNMVYLYVDDVEVGPLNHHWIGGTDQKETVDWVSGKDFTFSYMGTSPHTIGGCKLEYVQVWEQGAPCSHSYTAQVTLPTSTEPGYTVYTCSECGDSFRTPWLAETAYEGMTIACVGDSITAAYGVTKDETDYVTLLAAQLGMDYIRFGVSGTTLCTDGSRTCNIGKLTEANLNGADVVTIAMGINDFCAAGEGYYELGDIHSTDTSTIYGAVRMWCKRIEELRETDSLSDSQFYFLTPVICSWNNSVTSSRDWDQSKTNIHGYTLRNLCNAIIEVAALYDVAVVDLNLLSGMYYVDAEDNNTAEFGGDGVHPGEKGHAMMAAALANVLLQNNLRDDHAHTFGSWITTTWPTCLGGEQQRVCTVCSAAESRTLEPNGSHRYGAVVTAPTHTQQGYTTYTCGLCGDSYVSDYTDPIQPCSYRWEMQDNEMVSVTTGGNTANALTLHSGSVTNGTLTSVRYTLKNQVRLYHNLPWVIEWRSSGNWDGMLLGSTMDSSTQGLTYLFRHAPMDLLALGEYTGTWNNYGIVHDIDMTASHVFRLENQIAADGSNMVYLLVDGQEIDAMHHYYISGSNQNKTVNWADGRDIVFANIGTTSHPVKGMKLDYLQVWENGHSHIYENGICLACGAEHPNLANFQGKVISIMGDSISTFAGYIPVEDGYNREHLTRYPQDNLLTDVNETWWMQVVAALDAKLGINESWRGSTLSGATPVTSGDTGENAAMCNLIRIQNMGSNGTPDVILLYGGTNDLAHVSKVGTFDPATAPTEVDLTTKKWDNLADGFVHTLLRMRHFYPDAMIVALLPTYTSSYYSGEKLAQGNAVMADICEHYGIPYVDLRDSGVTASHLPDGIHPGEEGMDLITNAVLDLLLEQSLEPGENVVYPVTHELSHVKASLGHYKGISEGSAFVETLSGENLTVTITMGGEDVTARYYADGAISIPNVTDALVIAANGKYSLYDHLQQLPDPYCGVNLWQVLEHDPEYYSADGWVTHSSRQVKSITFPVTPGDRLYASSFEAAGTNGGSMNGIRVTYFAEDGVLVSMTAGEVYEEFIENGCLTIPDEAIAISIPMWTDSAEWDVHFLCIMDNHLQQIPDNVCKDANLWSLLTHDPEYYSNTGWITHSSGGVKSVTFPVVPGDRLYASSFGAAGTNGSYTNGIRVTYFTQCGVLESVSANKVYSEFKEYGYITVPEGARAVSVPMWTDSEEWELHLLNREHIPISDPAIAATCAETGLTEGSHCGGCEKVLEAQTVIPMVAHSYADHVCIWCGIIETSTFRILDTRNGQIETFTYEVGMTWKQWLSSGYNTGMGSVIAIWVSEGPDFLGGNPHMDIFVNGVCAKYDDVIYEQDEIHLIRYP